MENQNQYGRASLKLFTLFNKGKNSCISFQTAPIDPTLSDSNFLSIRCLWDTGDEERLSPWDMDPVSPAQTGIIVPIQTIT